MVLSLEYFSNMDETGCVPSLTPESVSNVPLEPMAAEDVLKSSMHERLLNLKDKSSEISIMIERVEWSFMSQEWNEFMGASPETVSSSEILPGHEVCGIFKGVIKELIAVIKYVLRDQLTAWKLQQRKLLCPSSILMQSLDEIENWYEHLLDIIFKTIQQLEKAEQFYDGGELNSELQNLRVQAQNLLAEIVSNSLVIEDPPPRVVKKLTKFSKAIALRCLCGYLFKYNKVDLAISEVQPCVEMRFINEAQARQMAESSLNQRPGKTSALFQKSKDLVTSKLEFKGKSTKIWSVYRNVQVIKVDDRKGPIASPKTDAVTDAKFCLHFYSEFNINGLEFKMNTISCPIVVVTHGMQESQAWATINWDSAFAETHRLPFQVPARISWTQLSTLLNSLFISAIGTRGLSEKNLKYLQENLCGPEICGVGPLSPQLITWTRFCKSILPNRNFSFWDWFYAAVKLIEKYGRNHWQDGLILGFISKTEAEDLLSMCQPGTFIIRFSDSVLGGISVAFSRSGGAVTSLAPFTSKHFQTKSLADTVKDFDQLRFVYPFTPKDTAFGRYYSPDKPDTIKASSGPGYVNTQSKLTACNPTPSSSTNEQAATESNYTMCSMAAEDKENASLYAISTQPQILPTTTSSLQTNTFLQHPEVMEQIDVMMTSSEGQSNSCC